MATNGNNANMEWVQPASTSAFRTPNHLSSSQDTDVSYLLRGDSSGHQFRPQYGNNNEYHTGQLGQNLHPGLHNTGLTMEEHFWPQQNDHSNNTPLQVEQLQNGTTQDENEQHSDPSDEDAPTTVGPARQQITTIPRSERRKLYKPKPPPSHPRSFRPFAPNETKDTMLAQWRTPPIVGSYVMFPNKKLKYNPVPPDLDQVRGKLFKMDESVLLKNSQEVADYVPHITNFWRRAVSRHEVDEETGVQYEHWHCRSAKITKAPAHSVGKGIRNKTGTKVQLHEGKDACKMRIRVASFTKHADTPEDHQRWGSGACKCVAEWVHFERDCAGADVTEHSHDQKAVDEWKRSEGLAILAKIKCEEGNSFSAVAKWLRKEYGDRNKQVYNIDKVDVANAAHLWRNNHKDLVLREQVPEKSDEMITMTKCVDAMFDADADSLRAALREVCKESDALTKVVLGVLEKNKPPAPVEEQSQEPWRLTEGVTLLDLPPPGISRKAQGNAGVKGPLLLPSKYVRTQPVRSMHRGQLETGRVELHPRMGEYRPPLGPDGWPILPPKVASPQTMPSPNNAPNSHSHPQQQGRFPALQPRPQPPPSAFQLPPRVETRYIQPPTEPPQRASLHPIKVTMEVPSCPLGTCKQCRDMDRGLAGRTFFFQNSLHTASHFTKLQRLLRDPKQILKKDYTQQLHQPHIPSVHSHPALHPRPVGGSAVGSVNVMPQVQQQGVYTTSPVVNHANQTPQQVAQQTQPQSQVRVHSEGPIDLTRDPSVSRNGSGEISVRPTPQPAGTSIYDMSLPIPRNVQGENNDGEGNGDGDSDGGQQPPAKRQRLESASSAS